MKMVVLMLANVDSMKNAAARSKKSVCSDTKMIGFRNRTKQETEHSCLGKLILASFWLFH